MGTDWSRTATWAAEQASVARARRFVIEQLGSRGLTARSHDASVVVSELATNAVVHAGTPFTVTLTARGDLVTLSVADASSAAPAAGAAGQASADRAGGRGLRIVAALSTDWGVEPDPDGGKSVWASFSTSPDLTRGTRSGRRLEGSASSTGPGGPAPSDD